ncbi:MAG: DUF4157 domain-containing protein, partial [bacterium]
MAFSRFFSYTKSTRSKTRHRRSSGKMIRRKASREHPILQMQQTLGNRAVGRMLQATLKVGQPDDKYEREADRVAQQVVNTPVSSARQNGVASSNSTSPAIQRIPETEDERRVVQGPHERFEGALEEEEPVQRQETEEEEPVQGKSNTAKSPSVTPPVARSIDAMRGGGKPLPKPVRSYFEPRFGRAFGDVRVHTDANASSTAKAINARA